jgi:hypothetical protein
MTTIGTSDSGVTGELVVNSSNLYSTFTSGEPLYILTQQTDITALVNGSVSLPATSLKIDTGKDTTTPYTGIQVNDIIVDSNGASARVTAIPAWTGNWHPNNNAAGTLTIAETQGASFTNNDTLTVYRPSASSSATFVFKDDLTDVLTAGTTGLKIWSTLLLRIAESTAAGAPFSGSDVNDIRIYVGDTAAHGSPTGSPLDTFRYADLRWSNPPVTGQPDQCKNDIQWPPDAGWSLDLSPYLCQNGTTYADYFTLVQGWVINSGADGSGTGNVSDYYKLTGTTEEPNSTIRTNKFTTNSLSSFTQQEIGLQVSGSNMATSGTYFDDFAVRLSGFAVSESNGFSNPLQY